ALPDWTLTEANAITPDTSAIVGTGLHDRGLGLQTEGWIVPYWDGCYANRDHSTSAPILNIQDFVTFLQQFSAGSIQANCDGSALVPILNIGDFSCFLTRFSAGCS